MPSNPTERTGSDESTDDAVPEICRGRDGCTSAINEPHPCPYAYDIEDNPESECVCCDSCTQECAMSNSPCTVTVTKQDVERLAQWLARENIDYAWNEMPVFTKRFYFIDAQEFLDSLPDAPTSGEPYCWLVTPNNGIRFVVFTQEETARYSQAYTITPLYAAPERDGPEAG